MRTVAVSALLLLAGPTPVTLAGVDLKSAARVGAIGSFAPSVAFVGDVNGDGRADVGTGLQRNPVGSPFAPHSDVAVVAFGGASPDARRAAFRGWVITNIEQPQVLDETGEHVGGGRVAGSIAGVGDWNGDGLADVAVGASLASPNARPSSGSVYVILGRTSAGPIDVRSADGVIRIDGARPESGIGDVFAPAGDIDGDGRPDLVIALPGEAAVIVRGGLPGGTTIDLANPAPGATIPVRGLDGGNRPTSPNLDADGEPPAEAAAFVPVGDVDGDGRGELLVGLPAQDVLGGRGQALVLRGVPVGAAIDATAALARIVAPEYQSGFASTVAAVPDSDGDGHPEWLIGAATPPGVIGIGGEPPGGAFVVFSRARGAVAPDAKGQPVVAIETTGLGQDAGRTVAGIADQTGDGVPDLLIGLPNASPSCRGSAGAIALVPGRRTPGTVRVTRTAPRVDGPDVGAELGAALAVTPYELLAGTSPFDNFARLDLWRVGLDAFTAPSPALPRREDCLRVTIERRTRAQLRRDPVLRVRLRSNAGDGRAHRLVLDIAVLDEDGIAERRARTLRLENAATRRLTIRLPRRALGFVRSERRGALHITAEQHVGSGSRTTSGAFAADGLDFGG